MVECWKVSGKRKKNNGLSEVVVEMMVKDEKVKGEKRDWVSDSGRLGEGGEG